jgi:hypothetical protein
MCEQNVNDIIIKTPDNHLFLKRLILNNKLACDFVNEKIKEIEFHFSAEKGPYIIKRYADGLSKLVELSYINDHYPTIKEDENISDNKIPDITIDLDDIDEYECGVISCKKDDFLLNR